ncbi:hypothetical protein BHE74_00026746 [Ensete ventricosum]|nr:hypothetical protein BHE74_00026746 [Ensete ventricosum]RZS05211.1 hypothetical protein BHM03_00035687 [Ensete ventricosum]
MPLVVPPSTGQAPQRTDHPCMPDPFSDGDITTPIILVMEALSPLHSKQRRLWAKLTLVTPLPPFTIGKGGYGCGWVTPFLSQGGYMFVINEIVSRTPGRFGRGSKWRKGRSSGSPTGTGAAADRNPASLLLGERETVKAEDGSSGFCTRGKRSCVNLETVVDRLGQLQVAVDLEDPVSIASAGRQDSAEVSTLESGDVAGVIRLYVGPSMVGARVRGPERRRGDRANTATTVAGTIVAVDVARGRTISSWGGDGLLPVLAALVAVLQVVDLATSLERRSWLLLRKCQSLDKKGRCCAERKFFCRLTERRVSLIALIPC